MAASLLHNGANINARFFLIHGGHDKYDDNGVDQHHCDDELSQSLMILILIMMTMKLNARTAWGDGVSHYAARHGTVCILRFYFSVSVGKFLRHGTVCMLRFLLYTLKFTFSNYAVCIFMIYDINKLGRCDT